MAGLLLLHDLMLLIKRVSVAGSVEDEVALVANIVVPTSNSVLGLEPISSVAISSMMTASDSPAALY